MRTIERVASLSWSKLGGVSRPGNCLAIASALIVSGGGLLALGIDCGWQQVSGGKSLATEALFNRLLGPASLLISSDIADQDAKLSATPTNRRYAERFCADVQLCASWMHAGCPIMIPAVRQRQSTLSVRLDPPARL